MAKNLVLKTFQKRERQLTLTLDSVDRFLNSYDDERDQCQISSRIQALEPVYAEFFEVRGKIELILEEADEKIQRDASEEVKEEVEKQREEESLKLIQVFEDRFFEIKGELLKLQGQRAAASTNDDAQCRKEQPVETVSRVKLPEIRLPSFSGKLREWVTFRDTFQSLIHNSARLTSMDKFTYLKSSLTGDALKEIDTIELSDVNYAVAWKTLVLRYENKKLIVKAYLDAIFSLQPLKREDYDSLNNLVSEFEKNLMMLEKMGEDTGSWSTLLAYMLCARLDFATLRHWETHHNCKEVPIYDDLVEFLRNHCTMLQSIAPVRSSIPEQRHNRRSVCHTSVNWLRHCPLCNEDRHTPFYCGKFQRMSLSERNNIVQRNRLCRNCLRPGHLPRDCERGFCHQCQQKHHTLLHTINFQSSVPQSQSNSRSFGQRSYSNQQNRQHNQSQSNQSQSNQSRPNTQSVNRSQSSQQQSNQSQSNQQTHTHTPNANSHSTQTNTAQATTSQSCVALPHTPSQNILLSTALVRVKDRFGNTTLARALLDSCSQHCLMTREFARSLKFRESRTFLSVQGIGPSQTVSTKSVVAEIGPRSSRISPYEESMQFYVLPKLTVDLPTVSIDPSSLTLPESTYLADPNFHESGRIDMIIGAEYYMDLLTDGRQKASENGPTLQNTVFGWIISGRIPISTKSVTCSVVNVCTMENLEDQLAKFWKLETCRFRNTHSSEESACEEQRYGMKPADL